MLTGFEGVVNTPKGTAYGTFRPTPSSRCRSFPIAGQDRHGGPHSQHSQEPNSWFVGFGPANTTHQYVVVVVVGQGGYGADAAAPAVASVFNYLYANPVAAAHASDHHRRLDRPTRPPQRRRDHHHDHPGGRRRPPLPPTTPPPPRRTA